MVALVRQDEDDYFQTLRTADLITAQNPQFQFN